MPPNRNRSGRMTARASRWWVAAGKVAAALQAYYEGRYTRAEKEASIAFDGGPNRGVAALLAARAAHQMRDFERRDRWLERAPSIDRQAFTAMVGLPDDRPFVLFTGSSSFISETNAEVAFVRRWIDAGRVRAASDDHGRATVAGTDLAELARSLSTTAGDGETAPRAAAVSARNRMRGIVTRVPAQQASCITCHNYAQRTPSGKTPPGGAPQAPAGAQGRGGGPAPAGAQGGGRGGAPYTPAAGALQPAERTEKA